MNLPHTVLLPQLCHRGNSALREEGSIQHWPPCSRVPAGRAPALREVASSSPCPKTFMLMDLGEAHQPFKARQQKMLGLSRPSGLGHRPPPAEIQGSGLPHLLSSRSSTCLVVAKAR